MDLEKIPCPFCGNEENDELIQTFDRLNFENKFKFKIVICGGCGFKFLNPRPLKNDISAFYQSENYQPFISTHSKIGLWDRIYNIVRNSAIGAKRSKIEKLVPKGRLLDIGCGTGEFLFEMQRHGWWVAGVESDQQAVDFANSRYHLNVKSDDLEKSDFADSNFDVITMWHVLEHLYDPLKTLKKMRNLLRDGGFILIAAPNIDSFDARFYKENWIALDAPRHLMHFTPASMGKFCDAAGLKLNRYTQIALDAFYNPLMSELLIAQRKKASVLLTLLYLKRAFIIALASLIGSSQLWRSSSRAGSSVLYYINKM